MEELAATKRREKQPLEFPSAGSTFKRPEGYFARKTHPKDAGLERFFRVGGAARYRKSTAGFVINKGGAAAAGEITETVAERCSETSFSEQTPALLLELESEDR